MYWTGQRCQMQPNYNYIWVKIRLTVVSVTPEEFVEPDEVRASAEMRPLADEHLLDEGEVVDDDTSDGAESEAEDVPVDLGEGSERDEGVGMFTEKMEVAEHRPRGGTRRCEVPRGDRQREVRYHPLPAGRQQDQQAEQTREQQQCADRGGHGDRHDHDWRRAQVQVPQLSSHAPSPPPPPPPIEPPYGSRIVGRGVGRRGGGVSRRRATRRYHAEAVSTVLYLLVDSYLSMCMMLSTQGSWRVTYV